MPYDVITIGGGLAGAASARTLALAGLKVLLLERETAFRDRVRGEGLLPWGVNEAAALGLEPHLVQCSHRVPFWNSVSWRAPRDLEATTPQGAPCLTFYHPGMQEALLQAAVDAGVEVRRGVTVTGLVADTSMTVALRESDRRGSESARLVIGADGRGSKVRQWGGFEVERSPSRLMVAGLLLGDVDAPADTVYGFRAAGKGEGVLLFPLGDGRARTYFIYRLGETGRRGLSGERCVGDFLAACVRVGVPAEWLQRCRAAGPLAEFDGADTWVSHPYRDRIALVGDAASCNDPAWGNGLSLTLRDVRTLTDALLKTEAWEAAGLRYGVEHESYFGRMRRITGWLTDLHYEVGPEADRVRARAYPALKADRSRSPDFIALGPEAPSDETARARLFGEI